MTMSRVSRARFKELYFQWLCSLIERNSEDKEYRPFNKDLHSISFRSVISMDENRAADGIGLRDTFYFEHGSEYYQELKVLDGPCTIFELFIGIAQRMDFILSDNKHDNRTPEWYWLLIRNLSLKVFKNEDLEDSASVLRVHGNHFRIARFIQRRYQADGRGGLFPIKDSPNDQRQVEIWYQMQCYIDENFAK